MGDPSKLKFWLVQNIDRFDIQIERLSWIDDLVPGLTDVNVVLQKDGNRYSGWGFGDTADLALTKALAELFERIVLQEYQFATSNGFAAHSSVVDAGRNAIREMYERDLFLCHFLTRTPLSRRSDDLINRSGLERMQTWFEKQGVTFSLHRLGLYGVVAVLDGRGARHPFGLIFGAAVKDNQLEAALSASIEACRDGARLLAKGENGPREAIALSEFLNIQDPSFSDHGRLALDLEYTASIRWFIEGNEEFQIDNRLHEVSVTEVDPRAIEFVDLPLKFVKAKSEMLQDLFVGAPTREDVNLRRLQEFTGLDLNWSDLNKLPHPFA